MYDETTTDSDSEDSFRPKLAFSVSLPKDFDPTKPPTNGDEYIHHVMYEASQCERVKTAIIDPKLLKYHEQNSSDVFAGEPQYDIKPEFIPSEEWQRETTAEFTKFRKYLEANKAFDIDCTNKYSKFRTFVGVPDYWELVQLSDCARQVLFEIIEEQLEDFPDGETVTYDLGLWIFALLATVRDPLGTGVCSAYRQVIRKCKAIRSKLKEASNILNLLICVVGRGFNQYDLADI